jgi:hypothetical protein
MEEIKTMLVETIAEPELVEEVVEELEYEPTTRTDYISSAYFAISSVEAFDTALMSKEDSKRIKRIIRKSIRIIDECINELHDEIFEDDPED